MTVKTKFCVIIKKTPLIDQNECDAVVIGNPPPRRPPHKRRSLTTLCIYVVVLLFLVVGVVGVLQIGERLLNDIQRHNRYQGFCSIPLSRDIMMLEQRKAPLRWKATENAHDEPDIQVISVASEEPEHIFDLLREVLDIDIDDSVEKISVFNNGHPVTFIHDFEANVTDIVDVERCFTMELDGSLVLRPEALLAGLQRGDEFDVSRARSSLAAALPPLAAPAPASAALRQHCAARGKPVYLLQKDDDAVIRKRSVDEPPHDYMQFAGKRVQEIEISNLAELLEYEQKTKLSA